MSLKTIEFNSVDEANAFVSGVFWVNDSTIELERAIRHRNGSIELILKDSGTEADPIPHLQVEDLLETIEDAWPVLGNIAAECWSDDHRVEVKFNAAPYFARASVQDILDLEQCEWSCDKPCDAVALWCENSDPTVERMFTYIRIADLGFECSVDRESAFTWLQQYRSELFTDESPLQSLLNDELTD
jgi:hypothetical protein